MSYLSSTNKRFLNQQPSNFNDSSILAPWGQYIGPGTPLAGSNDIIPNSRAQEAARIHDYQQKQISDQIKYPLFSYLQFNQADKNLAINSSVNILKDTLDLKLNSLAGDISELGLASAKYLFSKSIMGQVLEKINESNNIKVVAPPEIIKKTEHKIGLEGNVTKIKRRKYNK